MIYDIRHRTTCSYGGLITFSRCVLRLTPPQGPGQRVIESSITAKPSPATLVQRTCFFGNLTTYVTIDTPHRELVFEAVSHVAIDRPPAPLASLTKPWEVVREEAVGWATLSPFAPVHHLYPSRHVPAFGPAADYAWPSFTQGRPILEAAMDLMARIHADFRYDPKATEISTPLSKVFAQKRGVCQDFAHFMIAALHGLCLPASYVSGYLRTLPPPGQPRLEGADATHAWVSLWCGAETGWIGLDPTNNILAGNDHVVLANGRDYADISPVDGVILGSGDQTIKVNVDVIPVPARNF